MHLAKNISPELVTLLKQGVQRNKNYRKTCGSTKIYQTAGCLHEEVAWSLRRWCCGKAILSVAIWADIRAQNHQEHTLHEIVGSSNFGGDHAPTDIQKTHQDLKWRKRLSNWSHTSTSCLHWSLCNLVCVWFVRKSIISNRKRKNCAPFPIHQ